MKINSLFEVYKLYCQHLISSKPNSKTDPTANIQTALFRYTLPAYGLPENLTKEQKLQFMKQISIAKMKSFISAQNKVYEAYKEKGEEVSYKSQRTYRWALNSLLEWCEQQPWWFNQSSPKEEESKKTQETQKRDNRKVTDRIKGTPYALTLREIRIASARQSGKPIDEEIDDELGTKPEWIL